MSAQTPDYTPLTSEQLNDLTVEQKEVFLRLNDKDRNFYAQAFSPENSRQGARSES